MLKLRLPLAIGLLLTLTQPLSAESLAAVGKVTVSRLNVRAGGNMNYEVLLRLERGERVIITGEYGAWYSIVLPPQANCYISSKYLTATGNSMGVVNGNRVNVRGGPSTQYNRLGQVSEGDSLTILEARADGWTRILPPDGIEGWVAKTYIDLEDNVRPADIYASQEQTSETVTAAAAPTTTSLAPVHRDHGSPLTEGRIERSRAFWHRPATHKVLLRGRKIAYVYSEIVALDHYRDRDVQVWGVVAGSVSKLPLIEVTHITQPTDASLALE
jgi:uncharacterized protein YgiM (DUF1202 family)